MELRFLYIGSSDIERDLAAWLSVPGARLRWRFQHFGADVAAVDLASPPLVMVADHRCAGSVLPIYAVTDLDTTGAQLEQGGWRLETGPLGTPEGPASVWRDGGGGEIALLRVDRPDTMDAAFADQTNRYAVRPATS